MRVQTFLHGRRNKHGKRDTAGHAVRANTAELRDTAKLKLLAEPPRRTAAIGGCLIVSGNARTTLGFNESLGRFLRVLGHLSKSSGLFSSGVTGQYFAPRKYREVLSLVLFDIHQQLYTVSLRRWCKLFLCDST